MNLSENALLRLYQEHATEYRLQVQLGWDRAKFFVSINVALIAALSGFSSTPKLAAAGYSAGLLCSLLGAFMLRKTHRYYRNARDAFLAVERALGASQAGLGMSTTPGMSGASFAHKLRITDASVLVLCALALLDAVLGIARLL